MRNRCKIHVGIGKLRIALMPLDDTLKVSPSRHTSLEFYKFKVRYIYRLR